MMDVPRVFVSYSHDSDKHAARVLALADALSRDGCTVLFDQYIFPAPPDGWTAWMRQCLDPANSDFVLLVCTEGYLRRFEGREEPGAGRGVRREGRLIDSRLYEQDAQAVRYIPILLDPADRQFVPRELFDHNRYVLGAFNIQDPGYEALYRHLTGQPATPAPKPGEVIILPPKPRPWPSPGPLPPSGGPMTNVSDNVVGSGNTVNVQAPPYVVKVSGKRKDGQYFYGTGFILTGNGLVATCWDVIKDAAGDIFVKLPTQEEPWLCHVEEKNEKN